MDDFLKKVFDRLSVCLTYAGEDIEDFLWVLDQDEKEGRAPADVERMRSLYRQIKEQYAQDSDDLRAGMDPEDALELATHMVELYQAIFDYLMSEDPSTLDTAPVPGAAPSEDRSAADFNAMYELFKKSKEFPS